MDNQTTLNTSWENQLLKEELAGIFDIDMSVFDFDMPDVLDDSIKQNEQSEDDGYYGDERERTAKAYNMLEFDESACRDIIRCPFWNHVAAFRTI